MFATTNPRELAQGTTRVVPYRELALNITTLPPRSQQYMDYIESWIQKGQGGTQLANVVSTINLLVVCIIMYKKFKTWKKRASEPKIKDKES